MGSNVKRYSLAAVLLSVILFLLFLYWFKPGVLPALGYLVLSLFALISVPIVYRLAGFTRQDETRWLEEREEREFIELRDRLKDTRSQLKSMGITEGVVQADRLTTLIEDYHSVVETRFLGKKHMPLEYLGAARQVQKQAVQNLSDMVTVGHSMSTIDGKSGSDNTDSERKLTDKHTEMYDEQAKRIERLQDENDKMFDALTETAVEVANIDSFSRYERIDTLARLVSLSQIAGNSSS